MVTIWAEQALLAGGWARDVTITLQGDRIAGITTGTPETADTPNTAGTPETRDTPPKVQRVGLLLPAPVNLHSHAFQRAMAGLTESRGPDPRDSFWTWRQLMYRFLEQLTPGDVQAIAAFVQMEMAEAGYAAVAEFHYLHHGQGGQPYDDLAEMSGRIAAAAAQTGLGLTLLPVLYQYGGCDRRPLRPPARRGRAMSARPARRHGSRRRSAFASRCLARGSAPRRISASRRSAAYAPRRATGRS